MGAIPHLVQLLARVLQGYLLGQHGVPPLVGPPVRVIERKARDDSRAEEPQRDPVRGRIYRRLGIDEDVATANPGNDRALAVPLVLPGLALGCLDAGYA